MGRRERKGRADEIEERERKGGDGETQRERERKRDHGKNERQIEKRGHVRLIRQKRREKKVTVAREREIMTVGKKGIIIKT